MDASVATSVPKPGTLLSSRYRIGEPLGEGGMGVVVAARDEREGKDVAIKLLQALGEANQERFLREARLSMKIASDHVVKVLDVGMVGLSPFIVMERLQGEDFGMKIREGALGLVEVADVMVQTCEALAHAHGAGIVHRDIKASNIFEHKPAGSRAEPIVKVLDFGISKMFAAQSPLEIEKTLTRTRDAGFLGSPPYMSPEHVKDPRNVDGRADIWSLGVVAYRLLSTRFPFPGDTTGEVLAAILETRPRKLRALGIEVPDTVDRVIDRCLARDRDERFPDAGALAQAFAPFASSRFAGYATRVPEIVAKAAIPSPAESTSKRNRAKREPEPVTATVPPPHEDDIATLALDADSSKVFRQKFTRAPWEKPTPPTPVQGESSPPAPSLGPTAAVPAPVAFTVITQSMKRPKWLKYVGAAIGIAALGAAGFGGYVLTHRAMPEPELAASAEPPPPPPAPSASAIAPTPEPPASTAAVEPTPPTTRKSGRRPPPHAPAPAPSKKSELERNPYAP